MIDNSLVVMLVALNILMSGMSMAMMLKYFNNYKPYTPKTPISLGAITAIAERMEKAEKTRREFWKNVIDSETLLDSEYLPYGYGSGCGPRGCSGCGAGKIT